MSWLTSIDVLPWEILALGVVVGYILGCLTPLGLLWWESRK